MQATRSRCLTVLACQDLQRSFMLWVTQFVFQGSKTLLVRPAALLGTALCMAQRWRRTSCCSHTGHLKSYLVFGTHGHILWMALRRPRRRRARLLAARRSMRPALTFGQCAAAAPLLMLHAAVAWRLCFASYGWPAVLLSPGFAWTLPLLAWLLVARRRAVLAARRRGPPMATPVSPRAWPAALLPELPVGAAKDR